MAENEPGNDATAAGPSAEPSPEPAPLESAPPEAAPPASQEPAPEAVASTSQAASAADASGSASSEDPPSPANSVGAPPAYDDIPEGNDNGERALQPASALLDEKRSNLDYDSEITDVKLKYPKSVFFIISNEFCERFTFYGMKTILTLYMSNILLYSQDTSTVLYHVFIMLCYFFPVFGSMIADSWLGKFRTILYLSIVYAIGNIVVSFASAEGAIDIPARPISLVGLFLIAIGTGGIKPCVSAFGGDQFILPQQEKQMAQFFSLFYFSINSGSFVSTFLTPVLREDVKCFDQDSCYPLAFGVPAILMIISIIIFVAGRSLYIVKKPQGNVVLQVCGTMGHAVSRKWKSKGEKRDHWLDYADDKYQKREIEDIKAALRVLFLYIPLPVFWALYDQQGSRWTFQATRMTGKLGGWSLKPDQMQVVNPVLILLFIPLFETVLFPLLKKCNILTNALPRLGTGGVLAGLSFVISAIVELQLEPSYAVLPSSGQAQIRLYNNMPCTIIGNIEHPEKDIHIEIEQFNVWTEQHWKVKGNEAINIKYSCEGGTEVKVSLPVYEKNATSYLLGDKGFLTQILGETVEKTDLEATVRVLYDENTFDGSLGIVIGDAEVNTTDGRSEVIGFSPKVYGVNVSGEYVRDIDLLVGGVYTLLVSKNESKLVAELHEITPPNNLHMLWLVPQYVVLTAGEVMFSITGLEFSYSQAPISMKSVLQAGWLLTVAFGNLIVVIIAEAQIFDRQIFEFVLFAGLMFVDMIIFALMAMGYKYVSPQLDEEVMALEPMKEKTGIDNETFKTDD